MYTEYIALNKRNIRYICYVCLFFFTSVPLQKHAYSNIYKISPPKTENFQILNTDIFQISAQNIDCWCLLEPPQQGGSNKYPQYMFLSRNKINNVYPVNPSFIKAGFNGITLYRCVFVMKTTYVMDH